MPLGIVLLLVWLVLLVRFPRIMLPVSGILITLALLLAGALGFREWQADRQLSQIDIDLSYVPDQCDFGKPLALTIQNNSERTVDHLSWQLLAIQPGFNTNLVDVGISANTYRVSQRLKPGDQWHDCYSVPRLRSGYHPGDLEYHAIKIQADFSD